MGKEAYPSNYGGGGDLHGSRRRMVVVIRNMAWSLAAALHAVIVVSLVSLGNHNRCSSSFKMQDAPNFFHVDPSSDVCLFPPFRISRFFSSRHFAPLFLFGTPYR